MATTGPTFPSVSTAQQCAPADSNSLLLKTPLQCDHACTSTRTSTGALHSDPLPPAAPPPAQMSILRYFSRLTGEPDIYRSTPVCNTMWPRQGTELVAAKALSMLITFMICFSLSRTCTIPHQYKILESIPSQATNHGHFIKEQECQLSQ